MKAILKKATSLFLLVMMGFQLMAQNTSADGSNLYLYSIVGISVLLFIGMIFNIPSLKELRTQKTPPYASDVIHLSQGYDILLEGAASSEIGQSPNVQRYAVQPTNFRGLKPIPKMVVAIGDTVKAGDQLFFDKQMPDIQFVAPVSGEVIEINRGAKRAITEVVILADKEQQYRSYTVPNLDSIDRTALTAFMAESGAWSLLKERPYNVVPDLNTAPRDIFISTFDSAPLAPDPMLIIDGQEDAFQKGIDVLAKLTTGKVHLGLDARTNKGPADAFTEADNAEKRYFSGKHPVGNVGVQIHHTFPIGANDTIWTLGIQEVITIGKLFIEGRFDASRVVALTGAELEQPMHVSTFAGANLGDLLKNNIKEGNNRIISGDVLSGEQKTANNYLNWHDDQVTVVKEGDYYDMLGWILAFKGRPTISHSFPNFLFPSAKFVADTNTHGEKRAFVSTTDYNQVLPMDIHLQHLMKSVLVNDYERMEGLGLKELVEEDVALCEFACVSKQPLQAILREGLDMMHEQS